MWCTNLKSIEITTEEFQKLKKVGSGTFGTVFVHPSHDFAIKKYHENVKLSCFSPFVNPCLKIDKKKFKRLIRRSNNIKYSDTYLELVYQNLKFIGVKKKFYEGSTLDNLYGLPLSTKKDISTKLIRNVEELNNNRIYNFDYKEDNVLLTVDGEVKIIDLNDIATIATLFPNRFYRKKSLQKLRNTILEYLYYNLTNFSDDIKSMVANYPRNAPILQDKFSCDDLNKFVNSIKMEKNIIIIRGNFIKKLDLTMLRNYLHDNGLFLVIAFDKNTLFSDEKIIDLIKYLDKYGIDVYDIFKYSDNYDVVVNDYILSHDCFDTYTDGNSLKILLKK